MVTEMYGTGSSWRPAASLLDWAFAHGDLVEPVGRLVDRGEVPQPLAPATESTESAESAESADETAPQDGDSVVAAVRSPNGAVTPSLLPIAGGGGLVLLLLATRFRRPRARQRSAVRRKT